MHSVSSLPQGAPRHATALTLAVLVRGEPPSRRLGVAFLLGGGIATLLLSELNDYRFIQTGAYYRADTSLPFILERTLRSGNFFGVGDQTCGVSRPDVSI